MKKLLLSLSTALCFLSCKKEAQEIKPAPINCEGAMETFSTYQLMLTKLAVQEMEHGHAGLEDSVLISERIIKKIDDELTAIKKSHPAIADSIFRLYYIAENSFVRETELRNLLLYIADTLSMDCFIETGKSGNEEFDNLFKLFPLEIKSYSKTTYNGKNAYSLSLKACTPINIFALSRKFEAIGMVIKTIGAWYNSNYGVVELFPIATTLSLYGFTIRDGSSPINYTKSRTWKFSVDDSKNVVLLSAYGEPPPL